MAAFDTAESPAVPSEEPPRFVFVASKFSEWDTFRCPRQLMTSIMRAPGPKGLLDAATTITLSTAATPEIDCKRRGVDFEAKVFRILASSDAERHRAIGHWCPESTVAQLVECPTWAHVLKLVKETATAMLTDPKKELTQGGRCLIIKGLELRPMIDGDADVSWLGLPSGALPPHLGLGRALPDVTLVHLTLDGSTVAARLRVADIKSAPKVKRYHKLQIAYYHALIARLLQQETSTRSSSPKVTFSMSKDGEVWLDPSQAPGTKPVSSGDGNGTSVVVVEPFLMQPVVEQLHVFASRVLTQCRVSCDVEDVAWAWRLRPSCSACPTLSTCQDAAASKGLPAGVWEDPRWGDEGGLVDESSSADVLNAVPSMGEFDAIVGPYAHAGKAVTPLSSALTRADIYPRSIPLFSSHTLLAFDQTATPNASHVDTSGSSEKCGATTKKGTPCQLPKGSCRFHPSSAAELCGATTRKGTPCQWQKAKCPYHQSGGGAAELCGALTTKGTACKLPKATCRFHRSSTALTTAHGGNGSESSGSDNHDEDNNSNTDAATAAAAGVVRLDVEERMARRGVCCIALTHPLRLPFAAAVWRSNTNTTRWFDDAATLKAELITGEERALILTWDKAQQQHVLELICPGGLFDVLSRTESLASLPQQVGTFFCGTGGSRYDLDVLSMKDLMTAHYHVPTQVCLASGALLTLKRAVASLLPKAHSGASEHGMDLYAADRTLVERHLVLLHQLLGKVVEDAKRFASYRLLPISQKYLPTVNHTDASNELATHASVLRNMRQYQTVSAACLCIGAWRTRRGSDGKLPPLLLRSVGTQAGSMAVKDSKGKMQQTLYQTCQVVLPSELFTEDREGTAQAAQWLQQTVWEATGILLPLQLGNNQEHEAVTSYFRLLRECIDPNVDFRNGKYTATPVSATLSAESLTSSIRAVDRFQDWEHYGSTTRLFLGIRNVILVNSGGLSVAADSNSNSNPPSKTGEVFLRFIPSVVKQISSLVGTEETLWLMAENANDYNSDNLSNGLAASEASNVLVERALNGIAAATNTIANSDLDLVAEAGGDVNSRLTNAQRSFLASVSSRKTTLLWGPPGTGKTTTLSTLLARLSTCRASSVVRVLVTAFTNTALDQLFAKLSTLDNIPDDAKRRWIPLFRTDRDLGDSYRRVANSNEPFKALQSAKPGAVVVVFCTVWKLKKMSQEDYDDFDVLIVDEASQMPLSIAALAGARLKPSSRIVLAGDSLQLPPILPAPLMESHRIAERHASDAVLYRGSVLDSLLFLEPSSAATSDRPSRLPTAWLMDPKRSSSLPPYVVMLDVSFRSTKTIVNCVGRLYQNRLRARSAAPDGVAPLLVPTPNDAPVTVAAEAALVVKEVVRLMQLPSIRHIGIVTPHRRQKRAVVDLLLEEARRWEGVVVDGTGNQGGIIIDVDTSERMQGREYEAIIIALASVTPTSFIFDLRRLNVATSRAKEHLIVIANASLGLGVGVEPSDELRYTLQQLIKSPTSTLAWSEHGNGEPVGGVEAPQRFLSPRE